MEMKREEISSKARGLYSKEQMIRNYLQEYDAEGRKERILLIDVNCRYSSTGNIVYDLYQGIRADGRTAAVCYGRGPFVSGENIVKFGLDQETLTHMFLSRLTGYNGCYSPRSTSRLLAYIEQFQPDLIHIHELHAYFVDIEPLLRLIRKKNIPVVWTFHSEYMYTGKCGYTHECQNFMHGCGSCPRLSAYPKSFFFDHTAEMLKKKQQLLEPLNLRIVTPSGWLADRVRLSFLKDRPIRVIFNGVDTKIFHPKNPASLRRMLGIPEDGKVVLAVAPNLLIRRKGGAWVLKLAEEMKEEPVWFVMKGMPKNQKSEMEHVIFSAKTGDMKELADYYSLADVFVLFSNRETFSMTCAEALCCGTPVTGFRCGAPETIFEEPEAYFTDYGNIADAAEHIRGLLGLRTSS